MKTLFRFFPALAVVLLSFLLTGCEAVADIFQAGAWTGAVGIIVVIALVIWLLSRFLGGGNRNV